MKTSVTVCAPSKRINKTFRGRAKPNLISVNSVESKMIAMLAEKERRGRNAERNIAPKVHAPAPVNMVAKILADMETAINQSARTIANTKTFLGGK